MIKKMDDLVIRKIIERINKQREHLKPNLFPQDKIGDATYRICIEIVERVSSAITGEDK